MIIENIDTLDKNGNTTHHIGPSTEWWKTYDAQGREATYEREDGQKAITTYANDGSATVTWDPPLQEDQEAESA